MDSSFDPSARPPLRGPNKRIGETGPNIRGKDYFDEPKRTRYLAELKECGNRTFARTRVGVRSDALKRRRDSDPEFAQAELDAYRDHLAHIETAIRKRGIEGVEEPIIMRRRDGTIEIVGVKRIYSDRLLELYAKGRMKRYRDRLSVKQHTTLAGQVGVAVDLVSDLRKMSPGSRAKLREILADEPELDVPSVPMSPLPEGGEEVDEHEFT